ncbi:DoxX family protein [Nonomuraea polychroma]|uniref:DoxX family protein n=1 Tax=Nonomuraea polychroma TaxID=46176 RepID=UPI003D8C82E0
MAGWDGRVWTTLTTSRAPGAALWIRLFVGGIFASEGIQKFLFPGDLGTGRFETVGFPAPGFLAAVVGIFEIACGVLLLLGLLTRLAALPMVIDMVVALVLTKLPILWGSSALFAGEQGWWDFAHESRTDLAMLCGSIFLLLAGAGPYSLDARLHQRFPVAGRQAISASSSGRGHPRGR